MDFLSPGHAALNAPFRWRLKGDLCTRTLEDAFRALISRHETFRTALIEEAGEPVQCIYESVAFNLAVVDLSLLREQDAASKEADRLAWPEGQTPFDLASPPLIRAKLLRMSRDEATLLVTAHQTVADGWSEGIWARELGEIYSAMREGRAPKLPPLQLTYSDFAIWQRQWARGEHFEAIAKSYQAKYADATYFEVPPDKGAPETASISTDILSLLVESEVTDRFVALARTEGGTLFMAALSALLITLSRYTGETDISVGTQVAGRDEVELENVVGYFANTIVLRADLSGDPCFLDLLRRVRDLVLNEFDNQHLPYEKLTEFLRPRPQIGRNPLFSVNFFVQRAFVEAATWHNLELQSMPSTSAGALYDLNFFMVERPEGWRLSCEYKADLFERDTVFYLLKQIIEVMTVAVTAPDLTISQYTVGTKAAHSRKKPKSILTSAPATPRPQVRSRPLNEREQSIAEIWGRILPIAPSDPNDNFFDLGGDFWHALQITKALEKETGQEFKVAEIFEKPSLETFGALFDERVSTEDCSEIFTLQVGAVTPPIIAINMIMPTRFLPLTRNLGPDHSFYGVQVFDPMRPETFTCETYEELSARYVRLIRKVQPRGPYALLGWCAGGVLAFAVARELERQGEDVSLLAILDVWAPGYEASLDPLQARVVNLFDAVRLIKERVRQDWRSWRAGRIPLSEFLTNCIPGRIRRKFAKAGTELTTSRQEAVDYSLHILNYIRGLARSYKPEPIKAPIKLFLSKTESKRWFLAKNRAWDRLSGQGFNLTVVPGDHFSILDSPNVEPVARVIEAALAKPAGK